VIEHAVHVGQVLLGVWFVLLCGALIKTQKELRRLRRLLESSRKLREKQLRGG